MVIRGRHTLLLGHVDRWGAWHSHGHHSRLLVLWDLLVLLLLLLLLLRWDGRLSREAVRRILLLRQWGRKGEGGKG